MSGYGASNSEKAAERFAASHQGAIDFLKPDGKISRARAGLLFIESYRELPLLTWPRTCLISGALSLNVPVCGETNMS